MACIYIKSIFSLLFAGLESYSKKLVEELENVQKNVLRMCVKCWDSNYETLLASSRAQHPYFHEQWGSCPPFPMVPTPLY